MNNSNPSTPKDLKTVLASPIGMVVIISMMSNLLMLVGPLFMLQVYDRVLASRSVPTLIVLLGLVCVLYGFFAFLDAMRTRMAARIANVVDRKIAGTLFSAAIKLRTIPGATATQNPIRDGEILHQFLGGGGPLNLLDLPWIPIYLTIVFALHPQLGWLATGGAAVIILLMIANELMARTPSEQVGKEQAEQYRQSEDAVLNAETVVAMGMVENLADRWRVQSDARKAVQGTAGDRAAFFSSTTKALRFLLQSGVLALGAYLVIQGQMSGGLMIAASVITSRALAPVEQIVAQWRTLIAARQAAQRIKKTLKVFAETERGTELPLPTAHISVKQLSIAATGTRKPILSGVNFTLAAGDGVGVLGASGAGKSSLIKALVGVWPAQSGEIKFDAAPLDHYQPNRLGQIIGYMPQRVELFGGSVAQNIARFEPGAKSADIIEAANAASVHELISSLPNGYETQIGLQGELLSAGQRQRIGLARAIYQQPFLIVLDEPNSNLDAEGELALERAIQMARDNGSIVIVVAHRPSAISAVDKLLFLKDGRQALFGHKDEVLEKISGKSAVIPKVAGQNVTGIRTVKAAVA